MLPSKDTFPRPPALLLTTLVLCALFGWLGITSVIAQGPGTGAAPAAAPDSVPDTAELNAVFWPPFKVPPGCDLQDFPFGWVKGIYGSPDISADGSSIAFWSTVESAGNTDGNIEVFATNVLTRPLHQVTDSTGGILGGFNLEPDTDAVGSRIVFFSDRDLTGGNADANFEIFVYDIASATFTQVTDTRGGVNISPSISANGRWLAFASDQNLAGGNADGNTEIFIYDMDTATFTQITDTAVGINDQPAIDGAGSRIAFMTTANLNGGNPEFNQEIALYNTALQTLDWVTQATGGDSDEPAISRDGTVVAFASNGDLVGNNADLNYEIFVYDEAAALALTQATSTTHNAVNDQPDLDGLGLLVTFVSDWDFERGVKRTEGRGIILHDTSVSSNAPLMYPGDGFSAHPSIVAGEANVAFTFNRQIFRVKCRSSKLLLTKEGPAQPVIAGTPLSYTLTISNPGPLTASGLKLIDLLPLGLTYDSATASCADLNNVVTCSLPPLIPGNETSVVLTATVDPSTRLTVTNRARATAALAEPATATVTTTIGFSIDLDITKDAHSNTVVAGRRVTYTLEAYNDGPSQATGVTLTDTLPVSKIFTDSVTYSPGCIKTTTEVLCNLVTLDPKESKFITVAATIRPTVTGLVNNSASLNAVESLPIPTQERFTVIAESDLDLAKTAEPPIVLAGEWLTYTLVLTSHGPSQALNVTLTDTLSSRLDQNSAAYSPGCGQTGRFITCGWAAMDPGDSKTVTVTAKVVPQARGTVTNIADATSDAGDPDPGNNTNIQALTPITTSVNLSLTKTAPAQASAGGRLTYTLNIVNAGPSRATGVTLSDTLPFSTTYASGSTGCGLLGGQVVSCDLGEIDPTLAASKTITIAADIDIEARGDLVNSADVTPVEPDSDLGNNQDTASSTVIRTADLTTFKSASPITVEAGTILTYTIHYRNVGPSSADQFYMTDTLPADVDYGGLVSWSGPLSVPVVSPPLLTWYTATLPPTRGYHQIVFTVTVTPEAQAGPISNTVAVTSTTTDPKPGKETFTKVATVTTRAELSVVKWHAPEPSQTGSTLTYTLIYTNAGPSAAHDTILTDILPPGLAYQGLITPPVSLTGPASGMPPGHLVFTGTLPAGSNGQPYTETLVLTAQVAPVITALLTNTVEITSSAQDSQPADNRFDDPVSIMSDLAIEKYSTPPSGAIPGRDVLTYTIVVTNIGPSHVYSATVFDDLPDGDFDKNGLSWACAATAGSTCNDGSGIQINDAITLTGGGVLTYTVTGKLDKGAEGTLSNTAVVTAPAWVTDTNPFNNSDSDSHLLAPRADLAVYKMVDQPFPATGEWITYTIVVTSLGESRAHNVALTDTLPAGVRYQAHAASKGSYANNLWDIGRLDPNTPITLTITADVTQTVVGTEIVNTAWGLTATRPNDWIQTNNQDSVTITVTAEASLSLVKTVTTPSAGPVHNAQADPGDAITYTLSFGNDGPNTATGVVITDIVPVSLTIHTVVSSGVAITPRLAGPQFVWDVADMATNTDGQIIMTGVLSRPLATGPVTNKAIITSTVRETNVGNNRDQAVVNIAHRADLSIYKTAAGPDGSSGAQITAEPGEPVTYTLSFTNSGPYTATQVVITDQIPVSLTLRTVVSSGAVIVKRSASPDYIWDVEDLAQNAGGMITITGVLSDPLAAGTFTNTATITTSVEETESLDNLSRAAVTVIHRPDLVITKTVSGPDDGPAKMLLADPGDRITYTLTYTNAGLAIAGGIYITDIVPVSVTQRSFSASDPSLDHQGARPDFVWTSPALNPGEGGTITITGILSEPLADKSFSNWASIDTSAIESDTSNNSSEAAIVVVHRPDLTISKWVNPFANVAYHSEVTYTVILSNTGWGDAAGARLTDTLPTQVDFARWAPGGQPAGASEAGDVIQWLGQVTATEAITFTFLATHTGGYGDKVTNTAEYTHASRSGSADAIFRVQPFTVTITGPTLGVTNTAYLFTATVVPTAAYPLTYTWTATGQAPVVHGGLSRLTDTVSYTWPGTGVKNLVVAVSDMTVTITTTYMINIQ